MALSTFEVVFTLGSVFLIGAAISAHVKTWRNISPEEEQAYLESKFEKFPFAYSIQEMESHRDLDRLSTIIIRHIKGVIENNDTPEEFLYELIHMGLCKPSCIGKTAKLNYVRGNADRILYDLLFQKFQNEFCLDKGTSSTLVHAWIAFHRAETADSVWYALSTSTMFALPQQSKILQIRTVETLENEQVEANQIAFA